LNERSGKSAYLLLLLKNPISLTGLGVIIAILLLVGMIILGAVVGVNIANQESQQSNNGSMGVSASVLQWSSHIEEELKKYGLEQHLSLVLAIVMQESGGVASLDIMQSSESIGLPPNSITDPLYSIEVGVRYFSNVISRAEQAGVDLDTAIQSYNFGLGYINFIASNGGKHTFELAQQFSSIQANKLGWNRYGDVNYVSNVKRYLAINTGPEGGMIDATGSLKTVLDEMLKYQGYPYVFGGSNPQTSFDCSSLMQWSFKLIGVNLPRTAQEQYNVSKRITASELKAGDLVFFTGTYNAGRPVTHVGIYVGNNMMYDANSGGIGYSNLNDNYWQSHLYGYGRIVNF